MSSPMVNKDTLYCWNTEGQWYLGFYFGVISGCHEGWSMYLDPTMNRYKRGGWDWSEEEPFNKDPVGHRCLLQW